MESEARQSAAASEHRMDRLQRKSQLLTQLGALFGPLQRLIEHPSAYDEREKAETLARYFAECPTLQAEFQAFSIGQPGHNYVVEYQKFYSALHAIQNRLVNGVPLETVVTDQLAIARAAIDAVPVPRTSVIMEAGTPFTVYRRLRELCEVDATTRLLWLDPFLDSSIFHRYVANVRSGVPVTLVTSGPTQRSSSRDKARWAEFCDVSRLYAQERGSALYRLLVQDSLHDRWVVLDDKRIYALGGSAKDAGSHDHFTITSVEASATNLERLQHHIDTATEVFGPNVPSHR